MARKPKETGGGKLGRSETVTIRLDPRLNYLCELAARSQRRTKSSFIEAVIDDAIHRVKLDPVDGGHGAATVGSASNFLWSVREHDRLAALAELAPHLLTYDEQRIWAVLCENGYFWRGKFVLRGDKEEWQWRCVNDSLIRDRLAEYWDEIVAVALGEKDSSALPSWDKERDPEVPF